MKLDQIVKVFIENDSELSSNVSLDHSLSMDKSCKNSTKKKQEERKRKVKRVDYTLKITSNDIEKNNPEDIKTKKFPMNYHPQVSKKTQQEDDSSKNKFNHCIRKKNTSQQKRLNDRDIFGTNDKKVLMTQRIEKPKYSSTQGSAGKIMRSSKSTNSMKMSSKSRYSPNKNFKTINQAKVKPYSIGEGTLISNLKIDKLAKYKNSSKADRNEITDTWNTNLAHQRKNSN
jgi:hypothetical protein